MKKLLLAITLIFTHQLSNAQCSICNTTINTTVTAPQIVTTGNTLCIVAGGNVTGDIYVSGGTLCIQPGGQVNNSNFAVGAAGNLVNNGTINCDSLLIAEPNTVFMNGGSVTAIKMASWNQANIINNGTITVDLFGDSLASATNNNSWTVTLDFGVAYNGLFVNNGYLNIMRDFFCSNSGAFDANCVSIVGRDWYNSANITGNNAGSCGGFKITGLSYNSGIIGANGQVDICDLGSPPGNLDGNIGTINASVTYCTCNNNCVVVGIDNLKDEKSFTVYPNPSNGNINIDASELSYGTLQAAVYNLSGQSMQSSLLEHTSSESIEMKINLNAGIYFLQINDGNQLRYKKIVIE